MSMEMLIAPRPRRPLVLAAGIALAAAVTALAPAARGEVTQGGEATEAARAASLDALVEQGMQLRRQGDNEAALQVFRAAEAIEPTSSRIRVHLAATHQALGNWVEADRHLAELLQVTDDPYIERHRETLQRAAEFVAGHVGTLEVAGGPPGAEVRLSGRRLGVLPLSEPPRVAVGTYELEVTLRGHYALRRPVVIGARSVTRESVQLVPVEAAAPASPSVAPTAVEPDRGWSSPRWLSWSLTGLAAGAAATTAVAFVLRERHAERWNSDDCLVSGRTRGDVCRDELDKGRAAERVGYVSGAATLLLGAGAIVSWTVVAPAAPSAESSSGVATLGCSVLGAGAACTGRF